MVVYLAYLLENNNWSSFVILFVLVILFLDYALQGKEESIDQ